MKKLLMVIFVITFLIYFISSASETPYDYFGRMAYSIASGKLYITENPPWLNELIAVGNKYYIVYPPMPAILMVPFTFIFQGRNFQTLFSNLIGAINVVLVFVLMQRLRFSKRIAFLVTIFFGFGTNHWFLASVGSAWYLAHIVAVFFLLLALLEVFGKKKLVLISLFMGMSFWARTTVIFTMPFFYLYLFKDLWPFEQPLKLNWKNLKNLIYLHSGIFLFILLDAFYNFLRFRSFDPFIPYKLIRGYDTNTVLNGVYMSINYIPRHIEALFFRLPKFQSEFPYMIPSLYALAIWFTSPLIIYVLRFRKNLLTVACWAAVIPTLMIVMMWAGVGFSQFGYRFAQDFIPFLLILLALGVGKKPGFFAYLLFFLSILVNLWGVLVVNKLGLFVM